LRDLAEALGDFHAALRLHVRIMGSAPRISLRAASEQNLNIL
jgi:hypothetical protein